MKFNVFTSLLMALYATDAHAIEIHPRYHGVWMYFQDGKDQCKTSDPNIVEGESVARVNKTTVSYYESKCTVSKSRTGNGEESVEYTFVCTGEETTTEREIWRIRNFKGSTVLLKTNLGKYFDTALLIKCNKP